MAKSMGRRSEPSFFPNATFGAELVEHGRDFDEAKEAAIRIATERGLEYAPSFHRDFVIGVATYAHELFSAVGALDTVYVPIGLGSGICEKL
jgi:threonine dehydratase